MRYFLVRQHSEEDCGAACLATIAKHYGRTFALSHVREAVGTGARGTTLLGLSRVWPYRWLLAQAIAIDVAIELLSLASPIMMQLLTDDVLVRGDTQLLATVAIAIKLKS